MIYKIIKRIIISLLIGVISLVPLFILIMYLIPNNDGHGHTTMILPQIFYSIIISFFISLLSYMILSFKK